ncbi:MAG: acyl carrier protein [Bacteroidota bacterium]
MDTKETLQKIIRDIASNDSLNIETNSTLKHDLGLSSIDVLRLIDKVQSEFNFTFETQDYNDENFESIGSIISLVDKRKVKENAG